MGRWNQPFEIVAFVGVVSRIAGGSTIKAAEQHLPTFVRPPSLFRGLGASKHPSLAPSNKDKENPKV
jgi:hypothetical protein